VTPQRRVALGLLALSFFLLHATFHATHGRAYDILWNCTLSNAVIGLGLLASRATPVAVGVTWLCMGTGTWIVDVLTGGEFFLTSTLTHFGGLAVGILGARALGWPRRTWLWATGGMLTLQQICRLVTPPAANVNLAFSIYSGWERYYPTYRVFWLAMFTEAVVVYFLVGLLFRRWFPLPARPAKNSGPQPSLGA
jgi:hypothetical protein